MTILIRNMVVGCCAIICVLCIAHVTLGDDESISSLETPEEKAEYALQALDKHEFSKAADVLRTVAEKDMTPKLQYAFGWCHSVPDCLGEQPEVAFSYFMQSAKRGFAPAQQAVGSCYKTGFGVTANTVKAERWYIKAADEGLAEAQYVLAEMYCNGKGIKRDYAICRDWLVKAAKQDFMKAARILGQLYEKNPSGWKQNMKQAKKWYKKAADLGDKLSAYTLSELAIAAEEYEDARYWIEEAAEKGHVKAQWNMAGFATDSEEIFKWANMAAQNGHVEACNALANYFMEFDQPKALVYLRLASDRGDRDAQVRLARLLNADKPSTLLGLTLKGATQVQIEDHLKKQGIESEGATLDGVMRYSAAQLQVADSKLLWMAYEADEGGEKVLAELRYEFAEVLTTKEEITAYINSLEEQFGTPYNHTPLRINPKKKWQVFWALPNADVTLEYEPQSGMHLVMVPAE